MEVEKLNLDNVLELQKIRDILLNYDPKLLSFLEEIVSVANKKLNDEPEKKNCEEEEEEQEVEKWKAKAATYAAEQEDVPESVQVWRQVRIRGGYITLIRHT